MKLLFDQNLSPRLADRLSDIYPESAHVQKFGMGRAPDSALLDFAESHGFILVSKDSDFFEPRMASGRSTKIVWIRKGNCSTADIEILLRAHVADLLRLASEPLSLLMLY